MLHRFQPANHRLDSRTHLLVLLQQSRAFAGETIESLSQCAILFAKLSHHRDQFAKARLEQLEFLICGAGLSGFVHDLDYAARDPAGSNRIPSCARMRRAE